MIGIAGRLHAALVIGCACAALAGCQNGGGAAAFASLGGLASAEKIEAPGVPIALESIEGGPESVRAELADAIAAEASARKVELVSTRGPARYRIKGYLAAFEDEDGATTLTFVWDVFDTAKRRSRRIEGRQVASASAGADPWSSADQAALARLAAQSMNEIAGFLAASGGDEPGAQMASVE